MGLVGIKAIAQYFGFSESTIIKLHNEEGFPMTKLCGVWHSDGHLIEEWRRGRIMEDAKVRKYLKNLNAKEEGCNGRIKGGDPGDQEGKGGTRKGAARKDRGGDQQVSRGN